MRAATARAGRITVFPRDAVLARADAQCARGSMNVFVVTPCVLGSAADRRLRQAVMAAAESWIGRGPCQAVRPVLAFFLQASTPRSEPLPIGPCLPTSLRSNAPEWCRCACTLTSDSLLEHCEPVPRHVARCARRGTRHEADDTWRRPSPTPSRPLPALAQCACCERRGGTTVGSGRRCIGRFGQSSTKTPRPRFKT